MLTFSSGQTQRQIPTYYKKPLSYLLGSLLILNLSACGNPSLHDLENFIVKTQDQPVGQIHPLPAAEPYNVPVYLSADLRDPFMASNTDGDVISIPPIEPMIRTREILENWPLDSLRFVGSMQQENTTWALISDPDGIIHPLTTGNYLGQNHGQITAISEVEITLTEKYIEDFRGWKERDISLALSDE